MAPGGARDRLKPAPTGIRFVHTFWSLKNDED
jgi:hypothetical protein